MANILNPKLKAKMEVAIKSGKGVRAISRELSIDKNTVSHYTKIIRGRDVTHVRNPNPVIRCQPLKSSIHGICACGCGQKTTQYTVQEGADGKCTGQYRKWVKGHFSNANRLRTARNGLSIYKKEAANNQLRTEMVAAFHLDRFATRSDIIDKFLDRGLDRANVSKIFVNGLRDLTYGVNEDELAVPNPRHRFRGGIRYEPYERKVIPYERETDIKYLTKTYNFTSLDENPFDEGGTRHDFIPSFGLNPAEALMLAEEMEENADHYARRDDYWRWEEANKPLNSLTKLLT